MSHMDLHKTSIPVVGLLASAGGLDPLLAFFTNVPSTTGVAYLVLQHHGRDQPRQLPALLERQAAIPVRFAQPGDEVQPDVALVLSAGMTLVKAGGRLEIRWPHPVATEALPGDLLFQSMAEGLGEAAIGVVLSGSGQDGTEGLRAIQARGGLTLAQAPATAAQDGMPRQALEAGVVEGALPVGQCLARILEEVQALPAQALAPEDILAICAVLTRLTGNDFSHYKPGTLSRRIQRRLHAVGATTPAGYLALLEGSPQELAALENDLLIGVTEFFRDEQAFAALMTHLGPLLRPGDDEPVRVWVPGCASGEEAYSLAMLIREALEASGSLRRVQIFGTDLDANAILQAKAGRYQPKALRHVDPERLKRHFTPKEGAWVVSEALRGMCSFSLQNLLRDPPFSSLNLISCRNVLIYLDQALQARLIPLFHFALKPGGLLFLGTSESLAAEPQLFDPLDKASRIYLRRNVDRPHLDFPVGDRRMKVFGALPGGPLESGTAARSAALGLFEQMLLTQYLPASAIVNEQGEILFWAGRIGQYLTPIPGQPSQNLLTNTSGTLHWELRRLLAKAKEDPGGGLHTVVHHEGGQGEERLRITLRPMPGLEREARIYALIIQAQAGEDGSLPLPSLRDTDQPLLDQMNLALQQARGELQNTVEELAATNEEAQSANEELQSANEELQASQEELRSVNEDLHARNSQLNATIHELSEANADLQNLMGSTNIPTLFLDGNLAISRFTPSATQLFGLLATDLGRPIRNLMPLFTGMDLPALAGEVLGTHEVRETQVQGLEGDRWFHVRVNPYRTLDQAVRGVVVTFFDITEIRRAQMVALENEARYRSLFKSLVSGFAHCRMRFEGDRPVDYLYLDVNDAYMVQRGMANPTGRWITDLVPGIRERDEAIFQLYGRVARSGRPERHELFVSTLEQWYDVTLYSPAQDEFVAVFDVITARKQAEAALTESEERYRSLFEDSLAVLLLIDPADGAIVAANPAAAAFYGWPRPVLETMRVQEIILVPADEVRSKLTRVARQGQMAFAVQHRLADGRIRDVEVLASPILIAGAPRNFAIIQDVTERKQAEDAVRASRAKLEAALANMADAVFISDVDGRFLDFNEAFASFHRFPNKGACARTFAEYPDLLEVFLPGGGLAPIEQWAVPRALRGETAVNQEYGLRRKDTGETWVGSYNFAPLRDLEGRITGTVVTARDITVQKAAERALVESEARFRAVFDNAADAVLIRYPDGRFTDVNQVALDRYGYTREEFRRMTPDDLAPPSLVGQHRAAAAQAVLSGLPTEWVNMKKDGTQFPVEVTLKSFLLNGQTFICASVRDLSEQRRAEADKVELQEQLQQVQKMESLGRLAGGIAHDMNNVLGAIFAVTQVLQTRFGADPDMSGHLAIVEQAAQRGRDLVKGLVGFARKDRMEIVRVEVNALVRQEVALLERTLLQKIQLVIDLVDPLPSVPGEAGTLGSALMNLCVNAVDAMPEGGTLGIRTRLLDNGSVQLIVEDTGSGMAPEVVKRAMEPFFTTKPPGKGTGLGLAMVFNTVKAHGGDVAIESEEGKGTRILLTLPVLAAEPQEVPAEGPLPVLASAMRILVVDDDELIRSTVPLMLRVMGHQVEAVDGGRAALDQLSKGDLPDLVILDLNMPDLTGTETLKHIRSRFRDLPVLLATGFVEGDVERLVEADARTMIIGKPFSFEEIQDKFREVDTLRRPKAEPGPEPSRAGTPRPAAALFSPRPQPGPGPEVPAPTDATAPLAILLIEDNALDALLIEGLLKKRELAFRLKRIQTREELEAALAAGGIDLVLSDFRLPSWDGMAALRRVRALAPDLPFLFISGEVDEELFVEAMHEGANDFLFKDRLLRLAPAIEREVRNDRRLRQSQSTQAEWHLLHQAIQHSPDWVLLTDLLGAIVYVNPATEASSGYAAAELLGQNPRLFKSGRHEVSFYQGMWNNLGRGLTWRGLVTNRRKDGSLWTSQVLITPVRNEQGALTGYACTGRSEGQAAPEA